jgi:gustatory receptor
MSFKLLRLICKLGQILALTPPSIEVKRNTFGRKLYILAVCALVTSGVIFSAIKKNFYRQHIHIKIVVCFLNDFTLNGLFFYATIILGLRKRHLWKSLFNNFERTGYLTKLINDKNTAPYYLGFLAANFIHLVQASYVAFVWFQIDGFDCFARNVVKTVQLYTQFFYTFLLCVLCNMLLARYKGLKSLLETYMQQNSQLTKVYRSAEIPLNLIKKTEYTMCLLKKSVDTYNEMFGWPMFLIISYTAIEILNTIDDAIFHSDVLPLIHMIFFSVAIVGWTFVII